MSTQECLQEHGSSGPVLCRSCVAGRTGLTRPTEVQVFIIWLQNEVCTQARPIKFCSINIKKKYLNSVSVRSHFCKIVMFTCLEDYHIESYDLFREQRNGAG